MCVSPGEDFEAALDFTVAEAVRRGCGIHLALAVRPIWVGPPEVADLRLVEGEWRKYGTDFLVDVERRISKEVGPDTAVSTEITHGSVVPALVEVSQNAAIVVMQHHRMDRAAPRADSVGHERRGSPCARAGRGRARLLARGRPTQ